MYALLLYVLARSSFALYSDVDNYAIAVMVNGQFGRFGCQFLSPILCGAMYALSLLLPGADGFSIILLGFSFVALGLSVQYVTESALTGCEKLLCIAVISAAWFWARILGTNFMVNTVFFMEAGMLLTYGEAQAHHKRNQFWAVFFFLLGAMLRVKAAMLALPYLLLHYGVDFLFSRRGRKSLLPIVLPLAAIGIVLAIVGIYRSFPAAHAAGVYNSLRSSVVDYPVLAYADISAPEFQVSWADYNAATNWVFLHSQEEMEEIFRRIYQYGSCKNALELRDLFLNLYWEARELLPKLIFPGCVLSGLFCLGLTTGAPWYRLAEMVCAWLGSGAILAYFTYAGRAPLRIWLAVLMLCMVTCIFALAADAKPEERVKSKRAAPGWTVVLNYACCAAAVGSLLEFTGIQGKISKIMLLCAFLLAAISLTAMVLAKQAKAGQALLRNLIVCACAVTAVTMIAGSGLHTPQSALTARVGNEFEETKPLYEGDVLYIHSSPYAYFRERGKLPPKPFVQHNLSIGGWHHGQPYFNAIWESYGIESPEQALMERENTYLIASEEKTQLVLNVLRQDYGQTVQAIANGSFEGKTIWMFVKK